MLTASIVALAKEPNYAILSTLLPSGHPQTHVMWVDTDGENLLVNTVRSRQKFKNIQDHPQVSVTIVNGTDWFDWVEVRGTVVEIDTSTRAADHIEQLSQRYFGTPFGGPKDGRAILTIRPDRIVEHRPS